MDLFQQLLTNITQYMNNFINIYSNNNTNIFMKNGFLDYNIINNKDVTTIENSITYSYDYFLYKLNKTDNLIYNNYYELYTSVQIFLLISFCDILLQYFFGKKARWFQLHVVGNMIVMIDIFPDIIEFFSNPLIAYKPLKNHFSSYVIMIMHLYHLLTFRNLSKYDYIHHLVFVLLGVGPTIRYIKTNQIYLGYLACNGIPGIIEYGSLALYKNNKINLISQKFVSSILYIYLRLPLCIYGASLNYIAYTNGYINEGPLISLYLNFLLFLNGTAFTYLTLESYFKHKLDYIKTLKNE